MSVDSFRREIKREQNARLSSNPSIPLKFPVNIKETRTYTCVGAPPKFSRHKITIILPVGIFIYPLIYFTMEHKL